MSPLRWTDWGRGHYCGG